MSMESLVRTPVMVALALGLTLAGCGRQAAPPAEEDGTAAEEAAAGDISVTATLPPPMQQFAPPEALACTHVVAPGGSDSAAGTEDAPWATFEHAVEQAAPGHVICFRTGSYLVADLHTTLAGTPEGMITFAAYPGESPALDGGGAAGGTLQFDSGASYLRLSGFTITNYRIWGLSFEGDNHYIQLDHLEIIGGEAGIHFTLGSSGEPPEYGPVDHITLEDSRIASVVYTAVDCTPGPCDYMVFRRLEISGAGLMGEASYGADGLGLERGSHVLVEDCTIHDNGGDGIDLNSRDYEGYAEGIVVQGNRVFRNHLQGIKLWAGGTMAYNQVWGNGDGPVLLGVYPGEYVVDHNTIAYNMWDPAFSTRGYSMTIGYPEEGGAAALDLTFTNNIVAFNTGPDVGSATGIYLGPNVAIVSWGGNLFFSREDGEIEAEFVTGRDVWFTQADITSGAWAGYSGSLSDVVDDPLFVSGWPGVDLALSAGSPAAGAALDGSDIGAGSLP
jgi:hypothetical protein